MTTAGTLALIVRLGLEIERLATNYNEKGEFCPQPTMTEIGGLAGKVVWYGRELLIECPKPGAEVCGTPYKVLDQDRICQLKPRHTGLHGPKQIEGAEERLYISSKVVGLEGLEPSTLCLEGKCSIQSELQPQGINSSSVGKCRNCGGELFVNAEAGYILVHGSGSHACHDGEMDAVLDRRKNPPEMFFPEKWERRHNSVDDAITQAHEAVERVMGVQVEGGAA